MKIEWNKTHIAISIKKWWHISNSTTQNYSIYQEFSKWS